MKYLLIPIALLFMGCEDTYDKIKIDFDCRDGELYGTIYHATNATKNEDISQPKYYRGSDKVDTIDGSIATCKDKR